MDTKTLTVLATVNAGIEKVWNAWTTPADIIQWNNASPDWHTPKAENDLRTNGTFLFRMEAKNGSFGFDFNGVYTLVIPLERIEYALPDSRKVVVTFVVNENNTIVTKTFDPEEINQVEMQKQGWQSILDNFKNYVERTK